MLLSDSGVSCVADRILQYQYSAEDECMNQAIPVFWSLPDGGMAPLQARISLALPNYNTAEAVFRVNTSPDGRCLPPKHKSSSTFP